MKTKIILILVAIFVIVYWRGTKYILEQRGWDCNWHAVYAVCMTDSQRVMNAPAPKFEDVMKAGASIEKLNINFK